MKAELDAIWRYPIKGIGAEEMSRVELTAGRPLPHDRAWAVLEQGGDAQEGWRSCRNFLRGAKGPDLMGIVARFDGRLVHLSHPRRPDISVDPEADQTAFFDWLAAIYPEERPRPVALVASPPEGMADVDFASISILNAASLAELSERSGSALDRRRFRGNLWLTGLAAWEEFELVGRELTIGGARLLIKDRITRCRATEANPQTGQRDVQTLTHLKSGWGHSDFGVYAEVIGGGHIQTGDKVIIE